jgi:hypothetical protein
MASIINIRGNKLLSIFAVIYIFYFSSVLSCHGASNALDRRDCRAYGEQGVELEGVVSASPFNWPKKQRLDHYASFTLHLREPICVDAGKDELELGFEEIKNVEIGIIDAREYREIRGRVGARVRCAGNLQPAISGYHANSIILWNSECVEI